RFVTVARSDLSRLLFDKIKDSTEVIFGDELIGLEEAPDCVQVQFKRGHPRHFGLVIGADGLHSSVRRLTFGPQTQFEKPLGYLVAAFEVRGYRPRDEGIYIIHNTPGRMLGRVALHDDRTLFLLVLAADDRRLPTDVPGQKALLAKQFADDGWE